MKFLNEKMSVDLAVFWQNKHSQNDQGKQKYISDHILSHVDSVLIIKCVLQKTLLVFILKVFCMILARFAIHIKNPNLIKLL